MSITLNTPYGFPITLLPLMGRVTLQRIVVPRLVILGPKGQTHFSRNSHVLLSLRGDLPSRSIFFSLN